jgi:hypothetical protein
MLLYISSACSSFHATCSNVPLLLLPARVIFASLSSLSCERCSEVCQSCFHLSRNEGPLVQEKREERREKREERRGKRGERREEREERREERGEERGALSGASQFRHIDSARRKPAASRSCKSPSRQGAPMQRAPLCVRVSTRHAERKGRMWLTWTRRMCCCHASCASLARLTSTRRMSCCGG